MSEKQSDIGAFFGGPDTSQKVVPFGKYRGQPLSVLREDVSYMDWLAGQEGIRRQYPWIFNLTVNSGGEPIETPEHNRFQALFLDPEFSGDVYDYFYPERRERELVIHHLPIHSPCLLGRSISGFTRWPSRST